MGIRNSEIWLFDDVSKIIITIPHLFAIRPMYVSEIFSESIHGGRVTYHCHAAIVTFALHWNIWEPVDRSENMLPNMLSYFMQLITIKRKNYFTHLILLTNHHDFGEKTTKKPSQESFYLIGQRISKLKSPICLIFNQVWFILDKFDSIWSKTSYSSKMWQFLIVAILILRWEISLYQVWSMWSRFNFFPKDLKLGINLEQDTMQCSLMKLCDKT